MGNPITRILSTRPLAAALLEQAAGSGMLIDTLPFIATEPIVDATLRHQIRDLSRQPLVAIFTSMNAVEAVANLLELSAGGSSGSSDFPSAGPATTDIQPAAGNMQPAAADRFSGRVVPPWEIFCIGYATRQLVHEYFGEDRIAGVAASAATLADVIIGQRRKEVFFFCGDQRREELPEKLQQQDIRVNEWEVYTTIHTPHRVDPVYDGIVFFSPSAVHSFFSVNSIADSTLLFAIGQTTADTIRTYTANRTICSQSPEKEALIRQVIHYYKKI